MASFNNKKLQTQRNFQSIWHSHPENIGKLLKEDQLIREYIIGTMKAKEWKLSEIVIKRKVKQIHIAFQIQNKIIKERKRWTKNRLKNRIRYLKNKKRIKRIKARRAVIKKRYLFFQLFLMVTELRKMYPNNNITFYIQRTKPLQFNANLVNSWIIANMNKKKSYRRLLNRIIQKYKRGVKQTKPSFKTINSTWNILKKKTKRKLLAWITGNLIYLYKTHNIVTSRSDYDINNIPKLFDYSVGINDKIKHHTISKKNNSNNTFLKFKTRIISNSHRIKEPSAHSFWLNLKREFKRYQFLLNLRRNSRQLRKNSKGVALQLQLYKYFLPGVSEGISKNKNLRKKMLMKIKQLNISFRRNKYKTANQKKYQKNKKEGQSLSTKKTSRKEVSYHYDILFKRNFHTLRSYVRDKVSTIRSPEPNSIYLLTKKKNIHTNNEFEPLALNQISSSFINHNISRPSFLNDNKRNGLIKKIIFDGLGAAGYNKLKFYYLIKLKLAFLLDNNKISDPIWATGFIDSIIKKDKFNINQDIRTTWKLTRKLPRIQRRLGKKRRSLWKQHRNKFNEDILFLLNYYKYRNSINIGNKKKVALSSNYINDNTINFLWQGKIFIKFLQLHPPLLDHVIKCLINIPLFTRSYGESLKTLRLLGHLRRPNAVKGKEMTVTYGTTSGASLWNVDLSLQNINSKNNLLALRSIELSGRAKLHRSSSPTYRDTCSDPLIAFLTHVWIGIFDYIYHFENKLSKWQGIKISLKGRIGFKKMGRAKKYSNSWGVCKNSSAKSPLQYSYSQIHTRYGAASLRIFLR